MKLSICREGDRIICFKDFDDWEERGEIAHFLAELEIAKMELLEVWNEAGD